MSSSTAKGKTKRNRRGSLDRTTIVLAAIELADRVGVDRLTMRGLADELGYRVMALYNHVGNKDELLGLMVDLAAERVAAPSPDLQPMEAVRAIAISIREALVRHPWAAELWVRQMPGQIRVQIMENLLAALADTDLPPDIAHHGFHAVTNHVIGYTLQEIGMTAGIEAQEVDNAEAIAENFMADLDAEQFAHTIAHVQQHLNGETSSSFEFVLDLILDGLVRVGRR